LCSNIVCETTQTVPFCFESAALGLESLCLRRDKAARSLERGAFQEQRATLCRQNVSLYEHSRKKCSHNVAVYEHSRRLCSDKGTLYGCFRRLCSNNGALPEHSRKVCSYKGGPTRYCARLSLLRARLSTLDATETDLPASRSKERVHRIFARVLKLAPAGGLGETGACP
jgi:hypothetical protein